MLSPAPAWFAVMMVALILCGSIFTVAAYADDIRATRLRQHGLDVPDDPDLGHPTHYGASARPGATAADVVGPSSAGCISLRAASVRLPDSDG